MSEIPHVMTRKFSFPLFLIASLLVFLAQEAFGSPSTVVAISSSPEEYFAGYQCTTPCPPNKTCDAVGNCVARRTTGCFAIETRIRMGDGSEKAVQYIREGDVLWNPILKRPVRVKRVVGGPEPIPLVELGFGNTTLRVTTSHPIPTRNGLKRAIDLNLADEVRAEDGSFTTVTVLNRPEVTPRQYVWNFELEGESSSPTEHYLVANGIITGDLTLQEALTSAE